MITKDIVNQTESLQHNITIEYLPHGSDIDEGKGSVLDLRQNRGY
jgi:hypothetical protein